MTANAKLFEEKLNKLRDSFSKQLPSHIEEIGRLIETLVIGSNDSAALNQIHRKTHSLTGSGGTFGYSQLSRTTSSLEELLLPLTQDKKLDTDTLEKINNLYEQVVILSQQPSNTHNDEDHQHIKQDLVSTATPSNCKQKLLYIVDDDYELAENLATRLEQFEYRIECFRNTESAIKATEKNSPFAMLIDVMLTEGPLAGPELVSKLNDNNKNTPVLFMSTRNDWQARLACVRAGGTAYLPKPIKINEIVEKLDTLARADHEESFRVVIVDDVEVLAQHYAVVLNQVGMETTVVSNVTHLLDVLKNNKPELILMDLYMPESTGIEAATIIRQIDEYLDVPIVYLSTESSIEQKMDALKHGGDDFLQKPINDEYLIEFVTLRARRFRQLRSAMERDGLTNLINRIGLDLELEREISRSERENRNLVFVMIDVDNFKDVNDNYGHQVGDNVLKTMARLFTQRMRKSDIIGRYGGEEFAIILPNTDTEQAYKIINVLRESFSQITHTRFSGDFTVTFSAGLAAFPVHEHPKSLIRAADQALYEAKETGRNRVKCDADSLQSC